MAFTLPVKVTFHKAANYTLGRTEPVRAIVNHRMVGTIEGTRSYFSHPDRPVSTHFGVGMYNGVLTIDQYVPLDDTAYGNGNYDPSGTWDNWGFKTTEVNAQTISIEHEDNGNLPAGTAGRGIVIEQVQQASIRLQALLLKGSIAEWKAAGIVVRDWANNGPILQRELQRIPVDGHHIITHNDIAGNLKPTCWLPWAKDTIGFPRQKYVDGIKAIITPPVVPPPVEPPKLYTQEQLDNAVNAAITATKALNDAEVAALTAEVQKLQQEALLAKQEVKSKAIAYIQTL